MSQVNQQAEENDNASGSGNGNELIMKLQMENLETKNQLLEAKMQIQDQKFAQLEQRIMRERSSERTLNGIDETETPSEMPNLNEASAFVPYLKWVGISFGFVLLLVLFTPILSVLWTLEAKNQQEENCEILETPEMPNDIKLLNPKENGWDRTKTTVKITEDGLTVNNIEGTEYQRVFALKGFAICAGEHCRNEDNLNFPAANGTILYYYEVTKMSTSNWRFYVGLSSIEDCGDSVISSQNSYAIPSGCNFGHIAGTEHSFEWPNEAIKSEWNGKKPGGVIGCGLLLSPADELSIFFTANGHLMGKQIPINSTVDPLYPMIEMKDVSLQANFGDNPAKPFVYDIGKCAGLIFE